MWKRCSFLTVVSCSCDNVQIRLFIHVGATLVCGVVGVVKRFAVSGCS